MKRFNEQTRYDGDSADNTIHVYPLNDIRDHDLEGTMCECQPRVEFDIGILVIHNAWDFREVNEEMKRGKL